MIESAIVVLWANVEHKLTWIRFQANFLISELDKI